MTWSTAPRAYDLACRRSVSFRECLTCGTHTELWGIVKRRTHVCGGSMVTSLRTNRSARAATRACSSIVTESGCVWRNSIEGSRTLAPPVGRGANFTGGANSAKDVVVSRGPHAGGTSSRRGASSRVWQRRRSVRTARCKRQARLRQHVRVRGMDRLRYGTKARTRRWGDLTVRTTKIARWARFDSHFAGEQRRVVAYERTRRVPLRSRESAVARAISISLGPTARRGGLFFFHLSASARQELQGYPMRRSVSRGKGLARVCS